MDCYLTATFLFVHYFYTLFGSLEIKDKKKLKFSVIKDTFKYNFQKEMMLLKDSWLNCLIQLAIYLIGLLGYEAEVWLDIQLTGDLIEDSNKWAFALAINV